MDDPPVTEAIDLPVAPTLGQSWEVTDGNPSDEHLAAQYLVSPCGVFMTMLTTDAMERDTRPLDQRGLGSRLMAYDIGTGTKLWTQDLKQITGQTDPFLYDNPTYTPDCRMVLVTVDAIGVSLVNLVIDLTTGTTSILNAEDNIYCEAAGLGWAGCWGVTFEQGSSAVNMNDPSDSWREGSEADFYSARGDVVVAGRIWTPEGYRDPSTGTVDFGADTHLGETRSGAGSGMWVAYVEPYRPGGYRSGMVVRVEGPLDAGTGECQVMVWDPAVDAGTWPAAISTPCGDGDSVLRWVVAGQALLVTYQTDPSTIATTRVYCLADGTFLWEQEGALWPTPFDRVYSGANKLYGYFEEYVALVTDRGTNDMTEHIVRISDGAACITAPPFSGIVLSRTMIYEPAFGDQGGPFRLVGSTIDPLHPDAQPSLAWSVAISDDIQQVWTFATNGTMYLVHGNGQMWLTPLLT